MGRRIPRPVDESTDTYDTIDWLIKNIPETNGKVGILGISYDGFLPLMALVHPHPALKVAVPMNPMVDGWMGDDWFHNGAFREQNMPYIYEQEGTRVNNASTSGGPRTSTTTTSTCAPVLPANWAASMASSRSASGKRFLTHPAYDAFWSDQAMDKVLADDFSDEGIKVPIMLVHSLWDQEDIYGAPAVYKAIKPLDTENDKVFLVLGPWHHGQEIEDADVAGRDSLRQSDTGTWFRQNVLRAVPRPLPERRRAADRRRARHGVRNRHQSLADACKHGPPRQQPSRSISSRDSSSPSPAATPALTPLTRADCLRRVRLRPRQSRALPRPAQPAHRLRPPLTWVQWLVDDQREASGRTDVLTYTSDVLTEPVHITGQPIANLVASTTGTDSDWVVKLIDVYPDRGRRSARPRRLPARHRRWTSSAAAIARASPRRKAIAAEQAAALSLRAAHRQSCLPARPPHHGADPVELVPALRPQSADLRAQHLLGQAGGLPEGDAAHLSRARRGERDRIASGRKLNSFRARKL